MYNQFFTIKPRISEKNDGSKVVHLEYIEAIYIEEVGDFLWPGTLNIFSLIAVFAKIP